MNRNLEATLYAMVLAASLVLAELPASAARPLEDARAAHERGDDAAAIRLLLPLAKAGDASAQFALGFVYDTAEGQLRDDAEAAQWYRKAAEQGIAGAQYNLGAIYADGHGVPQDYVAAYKWLTLAASRFSDSEKDRRDVAVQTRDFVAAKMTPTQILEAQKLAREWMSK